MQFLKCLNMINLSRFGTMHAISTSVSPCIIQSQSLLYCNDKRLHDQGKVSLAALSDVLAQYCASLARVVPLADVAGTSSSSATAFSYFSSHGAAVG